MCVCVLLIIVNLVISKRRDMDEKSWTIVQFLDDKTVEAVPSGWIQGDVCHWPSFAKPKLFNAIRKSEPLNTCWPAHHIQIFRNATFDDYGKARAKARLAEETSDLASEACVEEHTTKRKRVQKLLSSSESSIEENEYSALPSPPKLKRNFLQLKKKIDTEVQVLQGNPLINNKVAKSRSLNLENKSELMDNNNFSVSKLADGTYCDRCEEKDKNFKVLIEQNHVLRSVMTETLSEVKTLKSLMEKININKEDADYLNGNFFGTFPDIQFPINLEEHFLKFEEILGNEEYFENAVKEQSRLGGSNTYNFVKRVLSTLLTNELALKFSFLGRKGKRPFKVTRMSKLVIMSAERIRIAGSHCETESAIATWLRRASDRRSSQKKFL